MIENCSVLEWYALCNGIGMKPEQIIKKIKLPKYDRAYMGVTRVYVRERHGWSYLMIEIDILSMFTPCQCDDGVRVEICDWEAMDMKKINQRIESTIESSLEYCEQEEDGWVMRTVEGKRLFSKKRVQK